jgi:hypothetical protein
MTEATGRILESVNFEYYTLSGTLLFVSSIFNFGATGGILKAVEVLCEPLKANQVVTFIYLIPAVLWPWWCALCFSSEPGRISSLPIPKRAVGIL